MLRSAAYTRVTLVLCALLAVPAAMASENGSSIESAKRSEPRAAAMCQQLPLAANLPMLVEGPENGPVHLTADDVSLDKEGISTLLGKVRVMQGGQEFSSEALNYDDKNRTIEVRAESLFRSKQMNIKSQSADFDLNTQSGAFNNTLFTLPSRAARGSADVVQVNQHGTANIRRIRYTTCGPDSNAWYLAATKVHLDYDEGMGSATNARLELGGVPVFYMPYFRFPIDNERHTGLLFPTVGITENMGFDFRQPIYLNIAPNIDDTFTPRYMSKRGTQLGNSFRYLLEQSEGKLDLEYLHEDRQTQDRRTFLEFQHDSLINPRLALDIHVADVSDEQYFEDFGGTRIDSSALTYLDRSARLTYQAPASYTVNVMVQDYQTIDNTILPADEPYRRVPQIRLDALTPNSFYNTRAGLGAEYDYFTRPNSIDGQRLDLQPFLRLEKDNIAWYTTSQIDARYTAYQLSNVAPGQPSAPQRTVPTFSTEGGLRFERITANGSVQTLEPQLMYLYTPYRNQNDIPTFDSGEPDFDVTELFSRNRYSGIDRIADANQAAFALSSRLLDPNTGQVRLTATIGQIYRFTAPEVTLPGFVSPGNGATDFISTLDYRLSSHWAASSLLQWAPGDRQFNRANFAVRYREDETSATGKRLDLVYRYRRGVLEQSDVVASIPLFEGWRAAGRWRYSIEDNRTLDVLGGLEYETCCWALRTSYRRYVANTSGRFDNGIYVQLELKGMTRIGTGFTGLLPINDTLPQ
ncbi:LPS-assembly protein LptD [Stenotrophobium rhamnosiphilum]|uniref:LPS-assembly protein LptD n=1 Tax=Stenotrophobium rhamnosiphilum TaxID=2029166 RepID=A0A2T5MJI9_9GAMM|nr:LPS assembly protein LptD [Stenotrophobium rhamnosiphilum]PTU32735.1 LPS-assembly protein LptD [Stenotrophobium rhamnosiphilum]